MKEMKVVINKCYGGFHLSDKAKIEYCRIKGLNAGTLIEWQIDRADPVLVDIVEKMSDSSGYFGDLKIVEIPDNIDWYIEEYHGMEWVAERHRTWG